MKCPFRFLFAAGVVLGASLDAETLVYSVTGTITGRSVISSGDPLPSVGVGDTVDLMLTITTGVLGSPFFTGLPFPRSMTYPMPTPTPILLAGKLGPTATLGILTSPEVALHDVVPGDPGGIGDRLLIRGFGQFSKAGATVGAEIRLEFDDPQRTALSSPDFPSGPITGFPEAFVILSHQTQTVSEAVAFSFVPTITFIPDPATLPEIVVEQPASTPLVDGASRSFGEVFVTSPSTRTFTIRNTGPGNLTGLTTTIDGPHAADFTVTTGPTGPVGGPNGTTSFTVQFKPSNPGARSAALHIANNDTDENPFDVILTGTGLGITFQPASQIVDQGAAVSFSVGAGGPALSFQWRKDGVDIPGAVGSRLDIPSAQPWHIGDYTVRLTSAAGSIVSETASLALNNVPSGTWRGLVAYYPLDGTADDLCRPGHPADLINTTSFVDDPARGGVAHVQGKGFMIPPFPGEPTAEQGPGGYLQIPRPTLVDGAPFTVSFFIKEEGFSLWHGESFVTMGEGASSIDLIGHYWIGSLDSTDESYGGNNVAVLSHDSNYVLNGSSVTLNIPWANYTLVAEGDVVRVYRDGLLKGTTPYKKDTVGDFFIGRHWWDNGNAYSTRLRAKVDDLRLYNRALTTPEVEQLSGLAHTVELALATDHNVLWSSGSTPYGGAGGSDPNYWAAQSPVTLDGIDAAEGRLGGTAAAESWMETRVIGPSTLYFSYRVKDFSGPYLGSGGFFLVVGGIPSLISPDTGTGSADTGWCEASAVIPDGVSIVRWKLAYMRGSSNVRAYVDQVWTSGDPRPRITEVPRQAAALATPFSWQVPVASPTPATLAATGLPPGLAVDAHTHVISGSPTAAGSFEATLTALNGGGQHLAKVAFTVAPGSITLSEGLDAPAVSFLQPPPGTAWTGAAGIGHDGVDSARGLGTPSIGGSDNKLSTVLNGPGTLSFWYRCESRPESPSDRTLISFYLGTTPGSAQPTQQFTDTTWTKVTSQIPAGPQTISWLSQRPPGVVNGDRPGELYVYLDEFDFAPATVPPQPTFAAWQAAWNVVGLPTATDTDGDGLTLPLEYAFGGSPYAPNPELMPVQSVSGGYFTLRVTKAPSPTDLLYFVQASKDLVPNAWTTSSVDVQDEDGTHILARCKKTISEQPTSYMRVRVLIVP